MKVTVFWGCKILTSQYAYEMSIRRVLPELGVELVDLKETHCCGDIVKSVNAFAAKYMAARVLALAEETGLENLLVPCNRCHFTLSETQHLLKDDARLREKISALLKDEQLEYPRNVRIWHIIDFLYDLIGLSCIKKKVKKGLEGLKFSAHIGCQIIRPSIIKRVDDPENPRKLDSLIEALGAQSVDYPEKLNCCGSAVALSHKEAALTLAGSKLEAVQKLSVDGLIDSCPACHTMFDEKQGEASAVIGKKLSLPVLYYTQLLGVALGIKMEELGLHLNQSPIEKIIGKL